MAQKAIVTAIQKNTVQVLPLVKEACSACTAGCAKRGVAFVVENPHQYPVNVGNVVILESSKAAQAVQGLIALFVPFLCAIGGYFLAPCVARLMHRAVVTEALRALCVLIFLFLSCAAIFVFTRKVPLKGRPHIVEVHEA